VLVYYIPYISGIYTASWRKIQYQLQSDLEYTVSPFQNYRVESIDRCYTV